MSAPAALTPWLPVARVLVASWGRRYRGILITIAALAAIALGLSLAGDRSRAEILFGQIMLFSPVIAGLLTMSGIVSDERESGLIIMWFQKQGSLFRTYFVRYVLSQLLLFGFCTLFAIAAATVGVVYALIPLERGVRVVFALWLFAFLPGAIVFALSAWGVKRDGVVALIVIIASLMLAASAGLEETATARIRKVLAFPLDSILRLMGAESPIPIQTAVIIVLGHCIFWTVLGIAGLRYTGHWLASGRLDNRAPS